VDIEKFERRKRKMDKETSIKTLRDDYPDIYEGVAAMQEKAIQTISETLKKQEFDKALKGAYPNWEKVLQTPEFQKFAQEIHEYSGLPIYAWLKDGFERLDSQRVIGIFDTFFKRRSTSPNRVQSPISVEEAKRALVKLSQDKVRGKFRGSEAEFKNREGELRKIILGV
jgi:hypothetical protein